MDKHNAKVLLEKYNARTCSKEERALVEDWLLFAPFGTADLTESELLADLNDISIGLPLADPKPVKLHPKRRWKFAVAAAALLLVIGSSYFYASRQQVETNAFSTAKQKDLLPGGNKALLTLADGRVITLENAGNGQLAEEAGVKIIKSADGQLNYIFESNNYPVGKEKPELAGMLNTITTPRGGQYQVTLPDGTKVWLNAASSLKFPANFAALNQRHVELTGEAYFEVAKLNTTVNGSENSVPFIVSTTSQDVEVLGTHFNINSYTDEPYVKTTLLEGSVRIKHEGQYQLIKPNQQALTAKNAKIIVSKVNTKDDVAWKNGLFSFKEADLQSVMRQISRWYDIEVRYGDNLPNTTFTGKIYRNDNLSKVLESIAYMGLNFKIQNNVILVEKK